MKEVNVTNSQSLCIMKHKAAPSPTENRLCNSGNNSLLVEVNTECIRCTRFVEMCEIKFLSSRCIQ
jgi:hypothetical protein